MADRAIPGLPGICQACGVLSRRQVSRRRRSAPGICLWDLRSRRNEPTKTLIVPIQDANRIMFSPDCQSIVATSYLDGTILLWDLKTGRVCRLLEGHTRPVNSFAFSPDGSLLATAGNDGMLGLWTVATGQRRVSLDSQAISLRSVLFSPDGQTLILATGDDDDVRSWDLAELLRAQPESDSSR